MPVEALAASIAELPGRLGEIFYYIVLPVLLLAAVGWILQRKLGLDMPTLTRLNFYFVVPGLVYVSLLTSRLHGAEVAQVVIYGVAMLAAMGAVTWVVGRVRGVPPDERNAMLMTTIFNNSGNYGLPLQDLAFAKAGLSAEARMMQVFVMIVQNVSGFTLGVWLAASGGDGRRWRENLMHIAKFPPIYALIAALATLWVRGALGADAAASAGRALKPFWDVLLHVKSAFVAVAICTLGAQLATVARGGRRYPVTLSVVLRLLVGPAVAAGVIYAMGIRGLMAQVLLISSATPTAVNCMLFCLQFDNHPDYAARAVFYSTLLSPITVTGVIFLAQGNVLPGFALP